MLAVSVFLHRFLAGPFKGKQQKLPEGRKERKSTKSSPRKSKKHKEGRGETLSAGTGRWAFHVWGLAPCTPQGSEGELPPIGKVGFGSGRPLNPTTPQTSPKQTLKT